MTDLNKLGKYEIRRELGQGAMGIVVEGYDPQIARRVALKTVRRDQLDRGEAEEILARFKREAQAAGRLNHPNIVQIYEYGEEPGPGGGTAFIAMEFIEGRELKDYFDANERFPMPEIVRIMTQLLDALDYSHRNGVVHRDIKPANIILLKDGTVKVADFGIARIESSTLTQAGSVLGTPSYMSPEQFMGQTVDGRSDLFSAGIILYQFLTGEKPFTGALTTIMHKVLREEPAAPSELNVQVPRPFDALMSKALAKRPDERFQSGREFAAALQAAVRPEASDEATVVVPADATLVAAGSEQTVVNARPSAPAPAAEAARPPLPPARHAPRLAVGVFAGVVLLGAAAAAYVMLGRGTSSPAGQPDPVAPSQAPAAARAAAPVATGVMVISALGLVDPADPRYLPERGGDKGLLAADLREDAKRQLVEKAIALYVEPASLAKNYGLVRDRMLSRSGDFIQTVLQEDPAQLGADGLMSLTTRATVRVREVQKSLNQMSAEERVEFIRNNGDPKISIAISARSADADPAAPAQRSPLAENLLKERVKSFGFRIWNDSDAKEGGNGADFAVTGEAKFRKLSAKLPASGITVEKFVLTSWTVKATDRKSGEEIYYNTQIPEKASWASEDEALRDVGKLIGEEFSRNFFLAHFHFPGQKVRLKIDGFAGKNTAQSLLRELNGLRGVLAVGLASASDRQAVFDAELSGGASNPLELVQSGILAPLNHKLGRACLSLGGAGASPEIAIAFEPGCNDAAILSRLESLPPAALLEAPPSRREAVVKNPETLKKISM